MIHMKRGLFIILFACSHLLAFSQTYIKATPYDTLGVAQIRVLYEMKFMPDSLNRTKFLKRMMVLDIGEHGFSRLFRTFCYGYIVFPNYWSVYFLNYGIVFLYLKFESPFKSYF